MRCKGPTHNGPRKIAYNENSIKVYYLWLQRLNRLWPCTGLTGDLWSICCINSKAAVFSSSCHGNSSNNNISGISNTSNINIASRQQQFVNCMPLLRFSTESFSSGVLGCCQGDRQTPSYLLMRINWCFGYFVADARRYSCLWGKWKTNFVRGPAKVWC